MNRRGFFQRLVGMFGVAVAAPLALEPEFDWQEYSVPVTFKGIPVVLDPNSGIYTLSVMCDNPRYLGVVTLGGSRDL